MTIFDFNTGDLIWRCDDMPMPELLGDTMLLTFAYGGSFVAYHYVINAIDTGLKRVFVTLQKVILDGAAISLS